MWRKMAVPAMAAVSIHMSAPARSQDIILVPDPMFGQGALNNIMGVTRDAAGKRAIRRAIEGDAAEPARSTARGIAPGSAMSTQSPAYRALAYRPSAAVSARIKQQVLADLRRVNPEDAALVEKDLTGTNIRDLFALAMQREGLKPDNLSDVFTGWWVLHWLIANEKTDLDPAIPQVNAVRAQVTAAFTATGSFGEFSDEQRQILAEILMYQTLYPGAAYVQAMQRNDRALMGRLSDQLQASFLGIMQIDLRGLTLTDRGFVVRD